MLHKYQLIIMSKKRIIRGGVCSVHCTYETLYIANWGMGVGGYKQLKPPLLSMYKKRGSKTEEQ